MSTSTSARKSPWPELPEGPHYIRRSLMPRRSRLTTVLEIGPVWCHSRESFPPGQRPSRARAGRALVPVLREEFKERQRHRDRHATRSNTLTVHSTGPGGLANLPYYILDTHHPTADRPPFEVHQASRSCSRRRSPSGSPPLPAGRSTDISPVIVQFHTIRG